MNTETMTPTAIIDPISPDALKSAKMKQARNLQALLELRDLEPFSPEEEAALAAEEVQEALQRRQQAEREAIHQQHVRRQNIAQIGVPKRFESAKIRDYRGDNPQQQQAWEALKNWMFQLAQHVQRGDNLMLTGSVGTGKTMLLSAIAIYAYVDCNYRVCMIGLDDMLERLQSAVNSDFGKQASKAYQHYSEMDLLLLDELGLRTLTETQQKHLFRVVNQRYETQKATIMSSNLSWEALQERLGERIVSRLRQQALCLDFSGRDRRLEA